MVRSAKDWPWSSYRATVGQAELPEWLYVDWLLSVYSKQRSTSIRYYKQFVADGKYAGSGLTFDIVGFTIRVDY